MSRQNHPYSAAPVSRTINNHGTSSAFSSSANLDEDWTKISDLAERRRIQNRIAQRNYRKKLKRRLEDLERRAGSSPVASPPETPADLPQPTRPGNSRQQYKRSPEIRQIQTSPRILSSQFTPPMQSEDENIFTNGFERDGSRTPPLFAYHTYPAPEDVMYPPFGQPYRPVSTSGDWTRADDYMAPVPVTLPSMMQFHDSVKREYEDTLTPFNMAYQGVQAVDIHSHHGYSDSHPHTPPLSHSFDHSTSCSDAGYHYPTTPLSMPASPMITTQI